MTWLTFPAGGFVVPLPSELLDGLENVSDARTGTLNRMKPRWPNYPPMTDSESIAVIELINVRGKTPKKISVLDRRFIDKIIDLLAWRAALNLRAYGHNSPSPHHVRRLMALAFKYRTLLSAETAIRVSIITGGGNA